MKRVDQMLLTFSAIILMQSLSCQEKSVNRFMTLVPSTQDSLGKNINPSISAQLNVIYKLEPKTGRSKLSKQNILVCSVPKSGKLSAAQWYGTKEAIDVYRIDLSTVVSKYIGETEKNLELVFARAESKNWVLFFDEADALFGSRTNMTDSLEREKSRSHLLAMSEKYNGSVLLAFNDCANATETVRERFRQQLTFK